MNYPKAFKIARTVKGWSQKELANLLGIDASFISKIEADERNPSTEILERLSEKTKIPLYLLILLGSEKEDLKVLNPEVSHKIGNNLLDILLSANEKYGSKI